MLLKKTGQESFIPMTLDKYPCKFKFGNMKNLLHVIPPDPHF